MTRRRPPTAGRLRSPPARSPARALRRASPGRRDRRRTTSASGSRPFHGWSTTRATGSPSRSSTASRPRGPRLFSVELDEVGGGRLRLSDEYRDREHARWHVEQPLGAARAPIGEDEADEVGSGFNGRVDIFLAREPADFDERARSELANFAAGSAARISAEPTRTASAPASSAAAAWARVSMPLSATTMRSFGARRTSASCAPRSMAKVERSLALMPITGASSVDGALELHRVVRFDERIHTQQVGARQQFGNLLVSEVAED